MITTSGKNEILRKITEVPLYLAFGLGTAAASLSDTSLKHEIVRVPVDFALPSYATGTVVVKASLPAEYAMVVGEVGVFSSGVAGSNLISDFSDTTVWTGGTLSSSNVTLGDQTLLAAPAASATVNLLGATPIDWTAADGILISYFVGSNVAGIALRLRTDGTNYYVFNLPTTAGRNVVRVPKASFTATGSPTVVNEINIAVNATSGGAAAVYFDSIAYSTPDIAEGLIARQVVSITKTAGLARDFELSLGVTV